MAKAEQDRALDAMTGPDEEEKEVKIDAKTIEKAFLRLREEQDKAYATKREKERALAKIKVEKSDVKVLATHTGMKTDVAERFLKESDGDLKACLIKYISEPPPQPVEG
eukprot:TRINITY_DN7873_c0_g1_i1.p2 TRINITY_DN7873_c0_g1~~TRINITY_DN7873_c0_g1_i1.p2  ORF type:complete len:109 (+),score=30.26 TRINITY_DN7873_c0_g1_i1:63-389(+)